MEVTKTNFKEVLNILPSVFEKAQFIAFDTEFTGLSIEGTMPLNRYDTPEILYKRKKSKVESFLVIQYGIVAFIYNEATDSYTHQGYNFYVYPSALCNDVNFTCQASSIKFLIENGFDFNKLFQDGIPYLRDKEKEQLLNKISEIGARELNMDSVTVEESDNSEALNPDIFNIIQSIERAVSSGKKDEVQIPKMKSFFRKSLYKIVRQKFGNTVYMKTNDDETMTASVNLTPVEYKKQIENKFKIKRENVLENIGFCDVIKLLIQSRKLLVGHNLLLDLMFTINQFVQPLPDTLQEFLELAHFLLPKIIDTKYLASVSNISSLRDQNLYDLIDYLRDSKDVIEIATEVNGVGLSNDDKTNHRAVYDAYLTGVCLLALINNLGKRGYCQCSFKDLVDSKIINKSLNRLYIRKFVYSNPFLTLDGDSVIPDRSNVFHITFPKEWTQYNINEQFSSCGPIKISWITDTSAYIILEQKFVDQVEKLKISNPLVKICRFDEHNGLNT